MQNIDTAAPVGAVTTNPAIPAPAAIVNLATQLPQKIYDNRLRRRATNLGLQIRKHRADNTYSVRNRVTQQVVYGNSETGRGVPYERVVTFLDHYVPTV